MVLCYNKESGKLYHANSAPATDVLFNSYEDKGFKESEKINVAGTGFSFVIKSNFGYGNASYLLNQINYLILKPTVVVKTVYLFSPFLLLRKIGTNSFVK